MSYLSEPFTLPEPVSLELLRVAAQTVLSPSVAASLDLKQNVDPMLNHLVLSVHATVQAQRIADGTVTESQEVVVETPATTWQMFKARHALAWWLGWLVRRRPVQMTQHRRTVTLTAVWTGYATFPDSSIVLQDNRLGAPIFQLMRSTDIRERSA